MPKKEITILNISLIISIAFVFVLISLSGVFLVIDRAAAEEAYHGVTINGVDFGGESYAKIKESLATKVNDFYSQEITLELQQEEKKISPRDLGIFIDVDQTVEEVLKIKNEKSVLEKIEILFKGIEIEMRVSIDEETLYAYLENNFSFTEKETQNADIVVTKTGLEIVSSSDSQKIDRTQLFSELQKRAQNLNTQTLSVLINSEKPQISDEDAQVVLQSMQSKLREPLYLFNKDKEHKVEIEDLENWLSFKTEIKDGRLQLVPDINHYLAKDYLEKIFTENNQPAENARLSYDPQTKKAFLLSSGKPGFGFATADNILKIKEGWLDRNESKINLVAGSVEPDISQKTIEELEITHLVGAGSTDFSGSPPSRVYNVKVAASKFDGVVIKPQEEFSFNKTLGAVDARNGFINAMVILGNVIKPSMGGGTCQVSTTAFQAAVKTGFKITDRSGHSFALSYYGEPGFDATVYLPKPDFKFINNTSSNILIQTKVEGMVLTFEYYGQDDHRQVEIDGPYRVKSNPNGSFYTVLNQKVTIDGKVIESNKFTTFYEPRSAFKTEKELEEEAKKKEEEEKKKQEEAAAQQQPPAENPTPEPAPVNPDPVVPSESSIVPEASPPNPID
jgi:vancomycin resistance protein YoaR